MSTEHCHFEGDRTSAFIYWRSPKAVGNVDVILRVHLVSADLLMLVEIVDVLVADVFLDVQVPPLFVSCIVDTADDGFYRWKPRATSDDLFVHTVWREMTACRNTYLSRLK